VSSILSQEAQGRRLIAEGREVVAGTSGNRRAAHLANDGGQGDGVLMLRRAELLRQLQGPTRQRAAGDRLLVHHVLEVLQGQGIVQDVEISHESSPFFRRERNSS